MQTTLQNLRKNRMWACYVPTKQEVVPVVSSLLHQGDTIGLGGSKTLEECGVLKHLYSGPYRVLDRYQEGLSPEDRRRIFRESFFADAYLCSSNAVTEDGLLYNVDGNANRVAAICYGPSSVILVVGRQKLVKNLEEAVERVKRAAAPQNAHRLACPTFCNQTGACVAAGQGAAGMAQGCASAGRICCQYVVSAMQREQDRIKVILVGEEVGF